MTSRFNRSPTLGKWIKGVVGSSKASTSSQPVEAFDNPSVSEEDPVADCMSDHAVDDPRWGLVNSLR